ncbi:hypothetical protein O181_075800 [Austropuccinia psidii MF-1]|uniref:Uncharacterized protein n=1 Tax=Austropuccinia psidii MF-1 TaxID=1389203 RepID=A0A9Q3F7C5_9BASI|nr:hypothetical protein [Austropuccinia psidii MF-1]
MSPAHLRNLGISRKQPEDREGFFRTRRPGRGHLGHNGGWQDTEGNHTHSAIHLSNQQKRQTRGLVGYGSSSSAPPTPQTSFPMEHEQQEVQASITLGRTWSKLPEDMSQRDILQRSYEEKLNQTGHTLIPSGSQGVDKNISPVASKHSGTRRSVAKSHHSSQSQVVSRRRQDTFQPKAERVIPNYPEAFGIGERSTQEPEIVVNTSRIGSPNNRNITPTQNEHNVVTPESNLNSNALWLNISQFAEKMQKQFAEL